MEKNMSRVAGSLPTGRQVVSAGKKFVFGFLSLVVISGLVPVMAKATEVSTGTVTVVKQVVNTHGGTKQPGDFTITAIAQGGILAPSVDTYSIDFPGDASGTPVVMGLGSYSFTETEPVGYTASYSPECTGTVTDESSPTTCTIINSDVPATVTVIVNVSNTHGGTQQPGDFTVNFAAAGGLFTPTPNTSGISFPGTASGTPVTFGPGTYGVTLSSLANYTFGYSAGCSGTGALGYTATCTITAQDPVKGSSGINTSFVSSGGGGGSSGGGAPGAGLTFGNGSINPDGQIAGAFTNNPNLGQGNPAVLGAATTLPRTGFGDSALLVLFGLCSLAGLAFVLKKKTA